jgi:hypothetical protein
MSRYGRAILTLLVIMVAFWGYRGSQRERLGPPLGKVSGQDFRAVLRAAQDIESHANLYIHGISVATSPNFKDFVTWDVAPYVYPPLMAALARPLLALQVDDALCLWSSFNFVLLVGGALMAVWAFGRASSLSDTAICIALAIVFYFYYYPSQFDLKLGQADVLMLFLLSLAFLLYQRGHDVATGIPLALAISVKPMLGFVLLFFAWKRQWRTLVISVGLVALLTVWGFQVAGWQYLPDYLQVNRAWTSGPFLAFPVNQSPTGFSIRAFTANVYCQPIVVLPWLARLIPIVAGVVAFGLWLVSVSPSSEQHYPVQGFEYGLTVTTLMLISPLTEDLHFTWALIPIVVLLFGTSEEACNPWCFFIQVVSFLVALYLGYPALADKIYAGHEALLYEGEPVASSNVVYSGAYLYGLVVLHMCLAGWLFLQRLSRRQRSGQGIEISSSYSGG